MALQTTTARRSPKPRTKVTYTPKALPEDDEAFVREPTVLAVFPISKTSWREGIKAGKYPEGVLLTPRCRAWKVKEIRQLLAELGA